MTLDQVQAVTENLDISVRIWKLVVYLKINFSMQAIDVSSQTNDVILKILVEFIYNCFVQQLYLFRHRRQKMIHLKRQELQENYQVEVRAVHS